MKLKSIAFTMCLLFTSFFSFAQTVGDIYNQTEKQRSKQLDEKDERKIMVGIYGDYLIDVGAKLNGSNIFTIGINVGLKVNMPVFASDDGTNFGNTTGDVTFSAGYYSLASDPKYGYPDLNAISGAVGFRLGLAGTFFIEPQFGYDYAFFQNASFKFPSSSVSGIIYDVHLGLTVLKGLEIYGLAQSGQTKEFGSPVTYGAGLSMQF